MAGGKAERLCGVSTETKTHTYWKRAESTFHQGSSMAVSDLVEAVKS